MGIFTKDITTMDDLFLHQLEDIYYAEQQLTKAIPKMAELATNADLKAGLKSHVIDTQNQIERLDKVFAKLGKQPRPAIDGLIKEANATAGEIEDKVVLDAAIVANSQAVEHYEISRYGALIAWAEELGHDDVVRLLTTNLNEEKAANTKLNSVALRKGVNEQEGFRSVGRMYPYDARKGSERCSGPFRCRERGAGRRACRDPFELFETGTNAIGTISLHIPFLRNERHVKWLEVGRFAAALSSPSRPSPPRYRRRKRRLMTRLGR